MSEGRFPQVTVYNFINGFFTANERAFLEHNKQISMNVPQLKSTYTVGLWAQSQSDGCSGRMIEVEGVLRVKKTDGTSYL